MLFKISEELATLAMNSMLKLRKGEVVTNEWLMNGVYNRQTKLSDKTYQTQFNFKTKTMASKVDSVSFGYM